MLVGELRNVCKQCPWVTTLFLVMDEFYYGYGLQIFANLANIIEKHCLQINPTYIGFGFAY